MSVVARLLSALDHRSPCVEVVGSAHDDAGIAPCVSSAHDVVGIAPGVSSAHDAAGVAPGVSSAEAIATSTPASRVQPFRLESPVNTFSMVPLSEGRSSVRFTASEGWGDKLRQAQHLMRHMVPGSDPIAILERALDLLIAERKKALFGRTDKPRRTSPKPASSGKPSRYIPRAVRREVADRDGEQCAFVAPDGHRCEERARIEIDHHRVPAGRGGRATTDNLRLLCSAHNALEAERAYGPEYIRQRIADAREAARSTRASRSETSPGDQHAGGSRPPPTASPEAPTAELPRVSPVTGRANQPLAAVSEPATENAEHSPPGAGAAVSGSAPAAGAIMEPTLATHRPDGATARGGSTPTG
jgi:hypothetical protein